MPGIVGIIGLRNSVDPLEKNMSAMAKAMVYSDNDLVKIRKSKRHILGVVNIDDGRKINKYYANGDASIECMIDGDVFVNEERKRKIHEHHNISVSSHGQECIPYIYQECGFNFINYIKGWFNIVIIDGKENTYIVVNSRFGMRPLYYIERNGYFIFSSELKSLMECSLIKNELNEKAVVDYALFNYPLGQDTYIRNVFLLDPATIVTIHHSEVHHTVYWRPENLFQEHLISREDSLVHAEYLLKKAVNQMHRDSENIGIAVTGGFDGRTVLSLVDKEKQNLFLYSFGVPESVDIQIPKQIAEELSYHYFPIYLDDNYGTHLFDDYALKTILFSDGRSSLARAHYVYASHLLSGKTKVILTGNCGSELLRAVHLTGEVISNNAKLIFYNGADKKRATLFDDSPNTKYYNKRIVNTTMPAICDSLMSIIQSDNHRLALNQRFYLFIMKEVFRKYFGTEMSMESPYLYNRSPYLDYEFVDFIFKTPLCGANYDFFVQNPFTRMHGQLFYSSIMMNNNKDLAKINTSRRYSPYNLLTTAGRIKAGLAYLYRTLFEKKKDEYNLTLGLRHFMKNNRDVLGENEFINTKTIIADYDSGNWQKNKIEFYKALSLALWLHYSAR
ncbi:MAG: hypothetical protein JSV97_07940 [candidate division WOR-3 bacterium]|nr:MAG: hypothetical protein JSV97_07940 [candidate division WOR-3 bacterium]